MQSYYRGHFLPPIQGQSDFDIVSVSYPIWYHIKRSMPKNDPLRSLFNYASPHMTIVIKPSILEPCSEMLTYALVLIKNKSYIRNTCNDRPQSQDSSNATYPAPPSISIPQQTSSSYPPNLQISRQYHPSFPSNSINKPSGLQT